MVISTLLFNLVLAEPSAIESSSTDSAPFTFTPSIVSIAEPAIYYDKTDRRFRPKDPANLSNGDAFNLGFDAARHNLEQRAEISKRTLAYAFVKGTVHGIFLGATDFWGIYASILPHLILNNSVVFSLLKSSMTGGLILISRVNRCKNPISVGIDNTIGYVNEPL